MGEMEKPFEHQKLINRGYKLIKIKKGFFKEFGKEIISPVYVYRKDRFCENVDVGYWEKRVSRFCVQTIKR